MELSTDARGEIGPAHIIYLDESMEGNDHILSALAMPVYSWKRNLDTLISVRQEIRHRYGVFTSKEIHTSQFLGGRGRYSKRYLSKEERAKIYSSLLQGGSELENVALFNAVSSKKQVDWAFERLLNRFQRNMATNNGNFLQRVTLVRIISIPESVGACGGTTLFPVEGAMGIRIYPSRALLRIQYSCDPNHAIRRLIVHTANGYDRLRATSQRASTSVWKRSVWNRYDVRGDTRQDLCQRSEQQ